MRKWKYAKHAKERRHCDGCHRLLNLDESLFCEKCFMDSLEQDMYEAIERDEDAEKDYDEDD
jgi:hypothetical protein